MSVVPLQVQVISECLSECKDCTGSYISETLGRRFVCHCKCHGKSIERGLM